MESVLELTILVIMVVIISLFFFLFIFFAKKETNHFLSIKDYTPERDCLKGCDRNLNNIHTSPNKAWM